MCKVPFEVAMRAASIYPMGVDSEQLRHEQCSAAPPDDSAYQAGGINHAKRLAQRVTCRRCRIGASSAPDERSRHSLTQDSARSRADRLSDFGWPSLWSAGGGMARQFSDRGRPDSVHFVFRKRCRVWCCGSLFGVHSHRAGDDFLCHLRAVGAAGCMVDRRWAWDRHLVPGCRALVAIGFVDGLCVHGCGRCALVVRPSDARSLRRCAWGWARRWAG